MELFNVSQADLKKMDAPKFNDCEHYYVKPQPDTMQTVVIDLGNEKYMTVCVMPQSDNVDVKVHGGHQYKEFGDIKAFFDMAETYENQ